MNKAKAMQILAIRLQNRQDAMMNEEVDSERRSYPWVERTGLDGQADRERRALREEPHVQLPECGCGEGG